MKAIKYLEEQKFGYDHFTELTNTGINPDNNNIAQFAEDYHQAKLNLLNIPIVVKPFYCGADENHNAGRCKNQCRLCSIDEEKK